MRRGKDKKEKDKDDKAQRGARDSRAFYRVLFTPESSRPELDQGTF